MSANSSPGFKQRPDYRIATKPAGTRVQVKLNGEVIAKSRDAVELKEGGDKVDSIAVAEAPADSTR